MSVALVRLKKCKVCEVEKEVSEFYRNAGAKDRLQPHCKPCNTKLKLVAYRNDPERYRKRQNDRRERLGPGCQRASQLKHKFDLTLEAWDLMLSAQGGCCAICRRAKEDLPTKQLCVDHNHATGAVRGLLCHQCNHAIGALLDSADICDAAAKYLRSY